LVNTARYRVPDIETRVDGTVSVLDVAPEMLANLPPGSLDTCQRTDGVEHPGGVDPAALNAVPAGAVIAEPVGWFVIRGATHLSDRVVAH
jgi:hypothetical protein